MAYQTFFQTLFSAWRYNTIYTTLNQPFDYEDRSDFLLLI